MDILNVISSLIVAVVAPLVITAIRRPKSKIEEHTARLQYWKVFFELVPKVDQSVSEETRQLCLRELATADEEMKNLSNEFVGVFAFVLTMVLVLLITLWWVI